MSEDTRIVNPANNRSLFTYFSEFEDYVWTGSLYLEVALLCLIFCAALIGNSMVIIIVCKFRKMKTTTNFLIASLASSDIIFALGIPFIITTRVTVHWILGDVVCKILTYIQFVSGTNSILTMMMISLDRYRNICHPHVKKFTLRQVFIVIILVWTFNILFCIPLALGFEVRDISASDGNYSFCGMLWPSDFDPYSYLGAMFILLFVLPLMIITFNYTQIFLTARKANERARRARSLSAIAETRYSNPTLAHVKSSPQLEDGGQKVTFLIHEPISNSSDENEVGAAANDSGGDDGLQLPPSTHVVNISLTDVSGTTSSGYHSGHQAITTSTPLPSPDFLRRDGNVVEWKVGSMSPRINQGVNGEKAIPKKIDNERSNAQREVLCESVMSEVDKKHKVVSRLQVTSNQQPSGMRHNSSFGNFSNSSPNLSLSFTVSNVQVKLIKMFVLIVVLYLSMFTPFFIIIVLILSTKLHISSTAFTWCTICCLANTPQNPIIYGYFNENFRKAFKQIFASCQRSRTFFMKSSSKPDI